MGFPLFLLVNAVQFIMPAAFVADLAAFPIYQVVVLCCLAVSYPRVLSQLDRVTLVERPITVCVLGLLVAVALSFLSQVNLYYTRTATLDYLKLVIYYLLLVANINSPARLRRFL